LEYYLAKIDILLYRAVYLEYSKEMRDRPEKATKSIGNIRSFFTMY